MGAANKAVKILFGIILIMLGLLSYLWWGWYHDLMVLVRGGLGIIMILAGLIFILLGWSD
jgi:hypothetical protein